MPSNREKIRDQSERGQTSSFFENLTIVLRLRQLVFAEREGARETIFSYLAATETLLEEYYQFSVETDLNFEVIQRVFQDIMDKPLANIEYDGGVLREEKILHVKGWDHILKYVWKNRPDLYPKLERLSKQNNTASVVSLVSEFDEWKMLEEIYELHNPQISQVREPFLHIKKRIKVPQNYAESLQDVFARYAYYFNSEETPQQYGRQMIVFWLFSAIQSLIDEQYSQELVQVEQQQAQGRIHRRELKRKKQELKQLRVDREAKLREIAQQEPFNYNPASLAGTADEINQAKTIFEYDPGIHLSIGMLIEHMSLAEMTKVLAVMKQQDVQKYSVVIPELLQKYGKIFIRVLMEQTGYAGGEENIESIEINPLVDKNSLDFYLKQLALRDPLMRQLIANEYEWRNFLNSILGDEEQRRWERGVESALGHNSDWY